MPGGYPAQMELCNANDQGTVTASSRGTGVTCGNNAYGSYTQIVASTPSDTCAILVSLQTNSGANSRFQQSIRVAVGGAGSEVVLIPDMIISGPSQGYCANNYFFPVQIAAGTRVAAAGYCRGGTDTTYVSVILLDGAYAQMEGCADVDSIGWSAGKGTSVTCGAANTKGSYSQLVASTANDYQGFIVGMDSLDLALAVGNNEFLIDIAIGGSGSEQVIIPNYVVSVPLFNTSNVGTALIGSPSPYFPIPIPAGTRVAARAQGILASQAIGVTLYGVYQ